MSLCWPYRLCRPGPPLFAEEGQRLEICTPQGIKVVTFDENGIATEQTGDESSEHCPLMITRDMIAVSPVLASAFFEFSYPEKFIVSEGCDDYSDLTKHDPFSSRDPPALS